ncbi:MAG TPA: hypothetical protein VGF72_04280 [Gaiellaceae bacterium]|jgi:hypothetical protein
MRKFFEIGGLVAAAVLIAFGAVAVAMGVNGRHTVDRSLQNEYIVGSSDMTPSAIRAEAQKAGIASAVNEWPTRSVANQKIDTGAKARAMAQYMHIHALEATRGFTYAQMGIYTAKPGTPKAQLMPGGGTENTDYAALDPNTKQPLQNGARQVWVTETALTTALNTSYMADQLGLFGIVVGIALLLTGIGFGILALGGALRNPQTALTFLRPSQAKAPAVPVA